MDPVLLLAVGWLAGLLAPAIQQRILRDYRRAELQDAILTKMRELRFTMASVAHLLLEKELPLTDEFLDWYLPILRSYVGPNLAAGSIDAYTLLRSQSPEVRHQLWLQMRPEGDGLTMGKYEAPLMEAHISELAKFPIDFQQRALLIRAPEPFLNSQSADLQVLFLKTFDGSLSPDNRARLERNLKNGYRFAGREAKRVADAITELLALDNSRGYGASRRAAEAGS